MPGWGESVKEGVSAGKTIIIAVISMVVMVAVGYYIIDQLNQSSNNSLSLAVDMFNNVLGPIGGAITFFGVLLIVIVASIMLNALGKIGGE